jgi:hypothetical protein
MQRLGMTSTQVYIHKRISLSSLYLWFQTTSSTTLGSLDDFGDVRPGMACHCFSSCCVQKNLGTEGDDGR